MSSDDYISKLFVKNKDKLNTPPSDGLWDKIEAKLDKDLPVQNKTGGRIVGLSRYFAAASVVLVVLCATYMIQLMNNNAGQQEAADPMAMNDEAMHRTKSLMDAEEVLPVSEAEEQELLKAEDKQQEKNILEKAIQNNNKESEDKTINIEDVEIKEAPKDLIVIETEEEGDHYTSNSPTTTNAGMGAGEAAIADEEVGFVQADKVVNDKPNYAAVSDLNRAAENRKMAEEITQKAAVAQNQAQGATNKIEINTKNRAGVLNKKARKRKDKYVSPMAKAHPRLKIFGWLLGQWVDNNESEGVSYETWKLIAPNTLEGKGFKLSDNQERIFEEAFRIEYRPDMKQVFLVMPLSENGKTIDYMLTKFDNERITFEQSSQKEYPDEIVLQRDLDGFTTIIVHNQGFLDGDQQRYLENRNRVSNVRAIRTMRAKE